MTKLCCPYNDYFHHAMDISKKPLFFQFEFQKTVRIFFIVFKYFKLNKVLAKDYDLMFYF